MKQNLINDVIQGMIPYLNNAQAEKLQRVLQHTLFSYAIIIENYKNIRYRKQYKNLEILKFDFTQKDFWVGYSCVLEECEHMYDAIKRKADFLTKARELKIKIESNPKYIRGHDAYTFLEVYLKQRYNIEIGFGYLSFQKVKPVIKMFEVSLVTE